MGLDFIQRNATQFGLIPLTRDFRIDSMWGNFLCASNGKMYVAAGNHETYHGDSWLFEVDPRAPGADTPRLLFSISQVLGVRVGTSSAGESKIHTRLVETADGKIVFATMQGGIGHVSKWAHYEHPDQYDGGHLFTYDPRTGNVHDYGIPVKAEGLQTQVLDRERNILYFVTWPKKLFGRFDLNTRRTDIYGVFSWSPARDDGRRLYFGRDILYAADGKVYSINHLGCLTVFDPKQDSLDDTSIYVRKDDALRANVLSKGGISYMVTSKGYLFAFDPRSDPRTAARRGKVDELGMVMPDRAAYTPNLAITADDKTLVYLAGSHGSYARAGVPLIEFDIASRRHRILGDLDSDFFPPSCFGAQVDARGRFVFALHGGEPSHSYLAIYDPARPQSCKWLVPHGSKPSREYHMEGLGGFGKTKGWVVADYQTLGDGPGQGTPGVPSNASAITSLASARSGFIYGATSAGRGGSAWLFRAKPEGKRVEVLACLGDMLPQAQMVRNALVEGSDGGIYGGTLALVNEPHTEPRSTEFPRVPDGYAGGHLFRWDPQSAKLADLGVPVKGQGIYAMCGSPDGERIYALIWPHAHLVCFDIRAQRSETVACIYDQHAPGLRPDEYHLAALPVVSEFEYGLLNRTLRQMRGLAKDAPLDPLALSKKLYVSQAIACDLTDRVYGSANEGHLFRYDPAARKLEILSCQIPMVCGTNYGLISDYSVQSLIRAADGSLYGGTAQDGYLFRLDPENRSVFNFGKPIMQGRIRGLAEWRGALYGIVGEDWGKTHLFRYDPRSGPRSQGSGMEDLGVLQGGGHSGFPVNVCACLIAGPDDRLYIGQSERSSCLLSLRDIRYEPLLLP